MYPINLPTDFLEILYERISPNVVRQFWLSTLLIYSNAQLTVYEPDGRGSFTGKGNKFFSTPQRPDSGANSALSPKINLQGREADHRPPSSAKVKNGGAVLPPLHTSSHEPCTRFSGSEVSIFGSITSPPSCLPRHKCRHSNTLTP
jgi:hypothetical protein